MNIFKTKWYQNIHQNAPKSIFLKKFSKDPHRKECAITFSQLKKHVPHLKFCILFYRIYRKGGWFYMYVSMYFEIMLKVVKYICRLRRYNYTHNQLIPDISISFFFFFWGGGAQNLSLPPGRQLPSLRHCRALNSALLVTFDNVSRNM